jgi:hypothetical protein
MEFDESIYNLIPKEQYVAPKPQRHRSQYPADLAPTASTFGLGTTSKPKCSNLSGKFNLEGGSHSHQAGGATMGQAKGALKPDTQTFRKKTTGNPILIDKKEISKYARAGEAKAAVPKHDEKPIHGLVSDKNFIVANAVENILAAPKLAQSKDQDYLKKKSYGAVPKYLTKIKNEIEDEYNLVREMQIEEQNERDRQKFLMPDSERQELIGALKKKWEALNKQFQEKTHYVMPLDTVGKKNRMDGLTKEMDQIENDIKKLAKNYIFVDTTQPSSYW